MLVVKTFIFITVVNQEVCDLYMTSNEATHDDALAALAVLAESAAAVDSTMAEEDHDITPVAAPADGAATAPNVESIVDDSQEENEGGDEAITTTATLMEPTAATNEDDVVMTAAHNDNINNDEGDVNVDVDDAMAESESHAISMASTALLIDLERRYMDMSMDYQKVKAELANAQMKIQQQQHTPPSDEVVTTLQRTLATKDQQIGQLQTQVQTQEETLRMVQEQKEQLLAKADTLQEDIRYGRFIG